jgi:thymidine kinase
MDYLKVALRTDLAAEDTSQAASRAIVHLIGPLSSATFCGKAGVREVAHAGSDRVVSCPDCLSFSRSMRDTPADNTSLTDSAYRTLRSVSTPIYHGLERRSRPRFIEADLDPQPFNGETMKHYTNVIRDDLGTVHALYDGETATACGAVNAADTMTSARAVSCDACMKAIINQQRASDHRMPPPVSEGNNVLATVRDIIDNCESRMIGDGSGEREYVLSQSDIDTLRGLRDAFIAENIIAAQKIVNDADLLEQLRQVCGYVENGSSQYVTIGQDDATREWGINVGTDHRMEKRRHYSGTSFHQAIRAAAAKEIEVEEPQAIGYANQDADLPTGYAGMASIHPVVAAEAVGVSADAVVEANRKLLLDRSNVGIAKYGVTLEQSGLTLRQFVQHALEETLDLANYLQATLMTTAMQDQKQ